MNHVELLHKMIDILFVIDGWVCVPSFMTQQTVCTYGRGYISMAKFISSRIDQIEKCCQCLSLHTRTHKDIQMIAIRNYRLLLVVLVSSKYNNNIDRLYSAS